MGGRDRKPDRSRDRERATQQRGDRGAEKEQQRSGGGTGEQEKERDPGPVQDWEMSGRRHESRDRAKDGKVNIGRMYFNHRDSTRKQNRSHWYSNNCKMAARK